MKARERKGFNKVFIFIAIAILLIGTIGFIIFSKVSKDSKEQKIPVLTYYYLAKDKDKKVSAELKNRNTVLSVEEFEKQMKYLADNQYRTLTLKEFNEFIKEKKKLPKKSVLITFDNSSKSNYLYAYPILKKYKMHAASFAVTSKIVAKEQNLDVQKVQPLSEVEMDKMKDVFEFGSHTHNLRDSADGSVALISKSKDEVKKDVAKSQQILKTKYMSYPLGKYNRETIQVLNELNMSLAFTSLQGYATSEQNPLEIKRWSISTDIKMNQFSEIVSGKSKANKK
ncbi:polysaccharide deacetylase family protein [Bacillus tropicus]|uniref:polysaccharide deacetylase family protein n=1 Tax=Bacillus cereus group TaxID=86661 RepID=UPI000945B419|nr:MULTISPECIES: polysaccharide deacetylase family protein [Bacillus cereus group]MDA1550473.1 polysaccharide deacetylase family protein [Bacillus cereus group sp. TH243-3LC]UOK46294.1 polysaccharide deacetylase family protein [Bacillus tropicus]